MKETSYGLPSVLAAYDASWNKVTSIVQNRIPEIVDIIPNDLDAMLIALEFRTSTREVISVKFV